MNLTFGKNFRITLFGESHSDSLGVTIEGLPAGIDLCADDFKSDLDRRKGGRGGTTARNESDIPQFENGKLDCRDGSFVTDGRPFTIKFTNSDTRPQDYVRFLSMPRPGHADFTSAVKYGAPSPGGGIFSGRMTLPIVAAGVVAKRAVAPIRINATLIEAGGVSDESAMAERIAAAVDEGDSVGGIVECVCSDMPAGIGEPFFDSLESRLAHAMFSIPGIRGIEFGDGFEAARMKGSRHNDPIADATGRTLRNGCGGINGGISNGNDVVFRVAVKPTSSISAPQLTFNFETRRMEELRIEGRHDACFALRVPPVVEALTACVIADLIQELQ